MRPSAQSVARETAEPRARRGDWPLCVVAAQEARGRRLAPHLARTSGQRATWRRDRARRASPAGLVAWRAFRDRTWRERCGTVGGLGWVRAPSSCASCAPSGRRVERTPVAGIPLPARPGRDQSKGAVPLSSFGGDGARPRTPSTGRTERRGWKAIPVALGSPVRMSGTDSPGIPDRGLVIPNNRLERSERS